MMRPTTILRAPAPSFDLAQDAIPQAVIAFVDALVPTGKCSCDGGIRRPGGCASEATWTTRRYRRERLKNRQRAGYWWLWIAWRNSQSVIRGATVPMHNFPCIILAI